MPTQVRSSSWKLWEWIGGASLLASAGALILFSKRLSLSYQVGLWGVWIAVLALLFRQGWIRLFGPVLLYDMVRSGRRSRNILLRCIYALALFLMVYLVYSEYTSKIQDLLRNQSYLKRIYPYEVATLNQLMAKEMAKFAESFFLMFMEVQFIGVFLLTPAYAAGAIAEEKDRRTLDFLLATDLSDREIVLGKLASRLLALTLLVLAGLPILSLIQFWGGIDPDLVLSGFAATGLTMLSLAGLSMLASVYTKKPRDAIVLSYLMVVGYLGVSGLGFWIVSTPRPRPVSPLLELAQYPLEWFSSGNLFVMIYRLREAQGKGMPLSQVLPGLLGSYAIFHGSLAFLCTLLAVARMRVVAMAQSHVRKRLALSWRWVPRPAVRGRPMLWKEIVLESDLGFNRLGRIVVALIILASFLPALWIIWPFLVGDSPQPWVRVEEAVNQWVRSVGTIVASLVLLGIGIRAAGAVSGERERQTLDSLLTSSLMTKEILFAKWLGSIMSVRWAFLWLCVIWSLGGITGGLDVSCLPWLLVAWLVYAAFMASLGLCLSTFYSSTQRASIWVLTLSGVLYGLPLLLSYFFRGFMQIGLEFVAIIPPVAMNWLAFRAYDLDMSYIHLESPMGVLISIVIGLMIWAGIAWCLWKLTIRRFNTLAGRRKVHIVNKTFAAHYAEFRPVPSSQ
jgi:ABC-type transport system involved in multi-copper enzyme maturation permease subunit